MDRARHRLHRQTRRATACTQQSTKVVSRKSDKRSDKTNATSALSNGIDTLSENSGEEFKTISDKRAMRNNKRTATKHEQSKFTFLRRIINQQKLSSINRAVNSDGCIVKSKPSAKRATSHDMFIDPEGRSTDPRYQIDSLPYFHGILMGSEVRHWLKNEGDYLLRAKVSEESRTPGKTWSTKNRCQIILSYKSSNGSLKHLAVKETSTGDWRINLNEQTPIECVVSASIDALLQEIHNRQYRIGKNDYKTLLVTPISKPSYNIIRDRIDATGPTLGQGQYGIVKRGWLTQDDNKRVEVAIKSNVASAIDQGEKLRLEGDLMMKLSGDKSHANIAEMLGCTCSFLPVWLVLVFYPNGGLENRMNRKPDIADRERDQWLAQVASACNFIISKRIVHRDIALRNILLDDAMKARICDFGLARRMYKTRELQEYHVKIREQEHMPTRYIPLETLEQGPRKNTFDELTDVYAYGVLVWELYSNGKLPWTHLPQAHDKENVTESILPALRRGESLPLNDNWPDYIKCLIQSCLNARDTRPRFQLIVEVTEQITKT